MTSERALSPRAADELRLDVDALGATVRIEIGGLPPVDREMIAEVWSGARTDRRVAPTATVTPRAHFHFDETIADLSTQVTLAALTARRGQLWMVHAGAVADRDGRVILFSGRSGMGKTTLMSRLAREYSYVTDESVGVTAEGEVLPYRKPLSVIEDAARAKRQASPRSLGLLDLPTAPLRLHAVVVLDRDPSHPSPRLEAVDVPEAVSAIAPQCSYLAELENPLSTLVGHIQRTGGALRLRYRESEHAIALVRDVFASSRPPRPAATAEPHGRRTVPAATGYVRAPVVDAVTIEDGRLVLLRRGPHDDTTIHIVDGIGPTLWHAANGVSFDELTSAAVRTHGEPEGENARGVVGAALASLEESGLVIRASR